MGRGEADRDRAPAGPGTGRRGAGDGAAGRGGADESGAAGPRAGAPGLLGDALGALGALAARLRAAADQALDRLEDPEEALAYARRRLLEGLDEARLAVAAVASADRALELQLEQLQVSARGERGASQGARAAAEGSRRRPVGAAGAQGEHAERLAGSLDELERARRHLDGDLDALVGHCGLLAARVEQALAAPVRGQLAPLGAQLAECSSAAGRLEQRLAGLRAQAEQLARRLAMAGLSAQHGRPAPGAGDAAGWSIGEELSRTRAAAAVEEELARLEAQIRRPGSGR